MKPQKILEIKGGDWINGLSRQASLGVGGAFAAANGYDPYNVMGYMKPSLDSTPLTAPTGVPNVITPWNKSGIGYFYVHTASKLYQYLINSPYTQTDVTAQVTSSQPIAGAIIWKNKYIYAQYSGDVKVFSNTLPVAIGSETEIMTNSNSANNNIRPMCIGADTNLYVGTGRGIGQITNPTTNDNDYDHFPIETGYTVRGLVNDGRYLIILADNNNEVSSSRATGDYNCRAYFWDMVKTTADVIYDFRDSWIAGGAWLNGKLYIFGYNGIYVCNDSTPPRMIWKFAGGTISDRPATCWQITTGEDKIFFVGSDANDQVVYVIKEDGNRTVFYAPYLAHDSTDAPTCLTFSNGTLIEGTSVPRVHIINSGSTQGNATVQTTFNSLESPHKLSYIKVALKEPLSSGQEVRVSLHDSNGSIISDTTTRDFTTYGAKKTFILPAKLSAASVKEFEDLRLTLTSISGAAVQRVAIYGIPVDDSSQTQ